MSLAPGPAADGPPDLDAWLPEPTMRTYHRCESPTDCTTLWDAAKTVRIGECGLLGRLICWRVPGTAAAQSYEEMFTGRPFLPLQTGEHQLLAGLCGTIWTRRPALAELSSPDDFRAWAQPGTVQVLFAQWVTAVEGGSVLVSEVRVRPIDLRGQQRLRMVAPLVNRFEPLIGRVPLRLAAHRAASSM